MEPADSGKQTLGEEADIIALIRPWSASRTQAYAWFRSEPLPSFGGCTAEALVQTGRAEEMKAYLGRIAMGGFA